VRDRHRQEGNVRAIASMMPGGPRIGACGAGVAGLVAASARSASDRPPAPIFGNR